MTHEKIIEQMSNFKSCVYYCMSDEIGGKDKTHHTHIYFVCSSAVRFSTVKNNFPTTHIDLAKGTSQENRDYVFKEEKWEKDKKAETNLKDTHFECGEMPIERQGARNDLNDLYDLIKSGMSNYDILEENPEYMQHFDKLDRVRHTLKVEEYRTTFRQLEVTYIYGKTETGKTRGVMEKYGYENVYRVTDYQHPFDSYQNQDVILFDEFCGQLRIQEMLNYLDGYPLDLPCRYSNKQACFSKVYIVSNLDLLDQYRNVQEHSNEVWKAFLRRIHKVVIYTDVGIFKEYQIKDYMKNYFEITT